MESRKIRTPGRRTVAVVLPPECRKMTPALSLKPDRDMTQEEIFNGWSADRTARNIGESCRAACVAAVDAAKQAQAFRRSR
ncbi:hypothetical protein GCM10007919_58830 [Rhizobium indigoferae]|nr:hypothetical protein GCM10007919_58830 [Rhizobium indigoferae]